MAKNPKIKLIKNKLMYVVDFVIGALSGLVGGLFGGGAGTLIVPTLTEINKLDTKVSHATAILSVLPLTIASSSIYFNGGYFDSTIFTYTVIGSVIGGLLGSTMLKKLPENLVSFIFSVVMIVAGVEMLNKH